MLRIRRDDLGARRAILRLEGHIAGGWVEVLERECLELCRAGRRVALDLAGVGFIDRSGVETLGRLDREGIEIGGCTPLLADVLEQDGIKADLESARVDEGPSGPAGERGDGS